MKKIIISGILAASLIVSPAAAISSLDTISDLRLQTLSSLGIMSGDENGNLNLTQNVTRAQFAKMAVSASVYKEASKSTFGVSPYSDVPYSHWAAGYISAAKSAGWINGYLDGTFRPNQSVKLEEAVNIVLKLLGYTNADMRGAYPDAQMSLYRSLKLNKNISASVGTYLTRNDCATLIYNMLTATAKTGAKYAASVGCTLDADGNIDYLALVNSLIKGPVIYDGKNLSAVVGFTPTMVYRNDKTATVSDIMPNDVIYYLEDARYVFAYSNRITGVCESILPDKVSPKSVVVNGTEYTLESQAAALAVSSLGSFKTGDNITILLGRGANTAAGIISSDLSETMYGIITNTGLKEYTDANDKTYTASYIQLMSTSGETYQYKYSTKNLTIGDIVEVSFENNTASVKKISSNKKISGKINSAATKIGNIDFSDDIEILDTLDKSAVSIKASRLKNVTIDSSNVLFYMLDGKGQLSKLILKNVTGDMYNFGIVTSAVETDAGFVSAGQYQYIVNGQSGTLAGSTIYSLNTGAFRILKQADGTVKAENLKGIKLSALTTTTASDGKQQYTISDAIQVYEHRDDSYFLTSADIVNNTEKYTLYGYYDNPESEGGRIRVIIAEAKK